MPYTSHGHWYGPGEPTQPGPRLIAKCFQLDGCATCRQDAGLTMRPEDVPDELIDAAGNAWFSVPGSKYGMEGLAQIEREVRAKVAEEIENSLPPCDLGLPCRDNAARIARGER